MGTYASKSENKKPVENAKHETNENIAIEKE